MTYPGGAKAIFAVELAHLFGGLEWQPLSDLFQGYVDRMDLPDSLFADPSKLATRVAEEWTGTRTPNFNQLAKALKKMIVATGAVLTLPYASEPDLSDTDRYWIAYWLKKAPGASEAQRRHELSVVRKNASAAFDIITRDNLEDADVIAQANDWEPSWRAKMRRTTDFKDPEGVKRSYAAIVDEPWPDTQLGAAYRAQWLSFIRTAVAERAPENSWIVAPTDSEPASARKAEPPAPDHAKQAGVVAAAFEQEHGRKLGALSAEALEAARRAIGSPLAGQPANDTPVPKQPPPQTAEIRPLQGSKPAAKAEQATVPEYDFGWG